MHGQQYSYRHRKTKKRDYRALWQTRINAAARAAGLNLQPVHGRLESGACGAGPQEPGLRCGHGRERLRRTGQDRAVALKTKVPQG